MSPEHSKQSSSLFISIPRFHRWSHYSCDHRTTYWNKLSHNASLPRDARLIVVFMYFICEGMRPRIKRVHYFPRLKTQLTRSSFSRVACSIEFWESKKSRLGTRFTRKTFLSRLFYACPICLSSTFHSWLQCTNSISSRSSSFVFPNRNLSNIFHFPSFFIRKSGSS